MVNELLTIVKEWLNKNNFRDYTINPYVGRISNSQSNYNQFYLGYYYLRDGNIVSPIGYNQTSSNTKNFPIFFHINNTTVDDNDFFIGYSIFPASEAEGQRLVALLSSAHAITVAYSE